MNIFEKVAQDLEKQGFRVLAHDFDRPWGGFFVIDESQAADFVQYYFPDHRSEDLLAGGRVSPKILLVAPGKRLSWQYHFRRSEVWTVVDQSVGVVRSDTDKEQALVTYTQGTSITLANGERHRLVGLEKWGVVAEIWQHTDPLHPSDEDDIVRLQDDFGRRTPAKV